MADEFGTTTKGKPTVIYRNFKYTKERDNHCGTTSWCCQKFQSMQCKARLITSGDRIVSNRQPEHTHSSNVATALARKAVGKMKTKMNEMNATSSSSQASIAAALQGAANKSNPLPCFVNISTTNRNFYKKIYRSIFHLYLRIIAELY